MKKLLSGLLVLGAVLGSPGAVCDAAVPAVREVPTGGGYSVTCQEFGVEMRGTNVKSCFLALPGEFPAGPSRVISCAAKYATAFRADGRVEYCTLEADAILNRTLADKLSCKAGGRVVLRADGTVESSVLKESAQLPYAKEKSVACRGGFAVAFRADGYVADCILDQESRFDKTERKSLDSNCLAGGLIAFDEDGKLNGCYPPAPPKGSTSQGGRTQ